MEKIESRTKELSETKTIAPGQYQRVIWEKDEVKEVKEKSYLFY